MSTRQRESLLYSSSWLSGIALYTPRLCWIPVHIAIHHWEGSVWLDIEFGGRFVRKDLHYVLVQDSGIHPIPVISVYIKAIKRRNGPLRIHSTSRHHTFLDSANNLWRDHQHIQVHNIHSRDSLETGRNCLGSRSFRIIPWRSRVWQNSFQDVLESLNPLFHLSFLHYRRKCWGGMWWTRIVQESRRLRMFQRQQEGLIEACQTQSVLHSRNQLAEATSSSVPFGLQTILGFDPSKRETIQINSSNGLE